MADAGLNAIEKALRAALNVVGVTGLVAAASHYNMLVPPGASFPAITFSLGANNAEGRAFSSDAYALDYTVKGIVRLEQAGVDPVELSGDIQAAINTVLHGQTISATGLTVYRVMRQTWLRYTEYDEGRIAYIHSGGVYRLWVN